MSEHDSDAESMGSLKEFIVADEEIEQEDEGSEDVVMVAEDETLRILKEEAEAFASSVQGTVVGGRTLRSRDPVKVEARRPKDSYMERFGREEEAKLMEKFTKKDIIEYLKTLESENREAYEATGAVWPKLTSRMTLEKIQEEYKKVKVFLDLPDSDDEESEDEGSDDEEVSDEELEESDDEESDDEEASEASSEDE